MYADVPETPPRPRSMAPASRNSVVGTSGGTSGTGSSSGAWGEASLARALFAYLSSGENQLSFHEGDLIALMGESRICFPALTIFWVVIIKINGISKNWSFLWEISTVEVVNLQEPLDIRKDEISKLN